MDEKKDPQQSEDRQHQEEHQPQATHETGGMIPSSPQGGQPQDMSIYQEEELQLLISLGELGNISFAQGDFTIAVEAYNKALDIAQAIGNQLYTGMTVNNLGNVYSALGDVKQAIDCYRQALDIARSLEDTVLLTNVLNNLGLAYSKSGMPADITFNEAANLTQYIQDKTLSAIVLNNQATSDFYHLMRVSQVWGKKEEKLSVGVEEKYFEALDIAKEIDDHLLLRTIIKNLVALLTTVSYFSPEVKSYQKHLEQYHELLEEEGNRLTYGPSITVAPSRSNILAVLGEPLKVTPLLSKRKYYKHKDVRQITGSSRLGFLLMIFLIIIVSAVGIFISTVSEEVDLIFWLASNWVYFFGMLASLGSIIIALYAVRHVQKRSKGRMQTLRDRSQVFHRATESISLHGMKSDATRDEEEASRRSP